tara:strand:- start:848 stop:1285 length:438 start_codon:yes stop_codon:yes gene_type:complete
MIKIPVLFSGKGDLPYYETPLSAGMDLRAHIEAPITLKTLERKIIPTGLSIALPEGYEAQVRPRSGLAAKHGISVLNSPGTIDADYRGEIGVILCNLSQEDYTISSQDRIAQLVIAKHSQVQWQIVGALPDSERGTRGFGSTGKK